MAVIKAINSKSSVGSVINYVADKEKTSEILMYGKDCSSDPSQAIEDMKMTKELYNKEDGRQYKHFVQSFDPKDNITPEKANQIGKEWAEKNFKGYEVFIATHTDKDHIHNHFVVNSVNFENGRKLVYDNKQLAEFKKVNDLICEREGLHITEPKKYILTSFNTQKYKALEKGAEGTYRSYMLDLWKNVNGSMKKSTSKEQFIQNMKEKGYEVNWSDTRKYITFVTPEGKKVRNNNLEKTFKNDKFSKEGLLNEFSRNGERLRERGGQNRESTSTPNVDWGAIERSTRGQEDRLSEQSSDDVVAEIQQKVRGVKDRTDKATGEYKDPNKELTEKQRGIERENEGIARELHRRAKKRDFGLDR